MGCYQVKFLLCSWWMLLVFWKVRCIRAEILGTWSNKSDQRWWSERSSTFHTDMFSSHWEISYRFLTIPKTRTGTEPPPVWVDVPVSEGRFLRRPMTLRSRWLRGLIPKSDQHGLFERFAKWSLVFPVGSINDHFMITPYISIHWSTTMAIFLLDLPSNLSVWSHVACPNLLASYPPVIRFGNCKSPFRWCSIEATCQYI